MNAMDENPVYRECLGRIKREGMAKRKDGTWGYRKQYTEEPCGWNTGRKSEDIPSSDAREPTLIKRSGETPAPGHTTETGRLVLADYRAG